MSHSLAARTCAVVVTYNRAALLRMCLASIRAQTTPPAHIIVLDNASTDETAAVLAQEPGIEVVRLEENGGASGGFAAGIAHAAAQGWDWLWVMDDDVEAHPDALERLLESATPEAAALGSLKVGVDGQPQRFQQADYSVRWQRKSPLGTRPGDPPLEVSFLSFVSLLIRGDVACMERPRTDFFIDQDDTEYSLRLRRHGALRLVPESVVVHHNEQTSHRRRVLGRTVATGGRWRVYYAVRNPLLIARLHGSAADQFIAAGVGAVRLAGRLGAAILHHGFDLRRWWLAARGYADGIRGRSGRAVQPGDYR